MSENYSAEAELILSVDKFINGGRTAAEVIRALGGVVNHVQENVRGLDKELDAAQRGLSGTTKAAKDTSKAVDSGSAQWQQYVKDLKAANAEYQKFQQGQVTGEGGGTSLAGTKNASTLLATSGAQGANVIRDLKAEQAAVEAVGQARLATNAKTYAAERRSVEEVGQARLKANAEAFAAEEKSRLAGLNSGQKDSHVQAFEARNAALEKTSKQTALYNQYLFDEEKASQKATAATNDHSTSLISTRYALYDVATTYGILSTAMLASAALTVTTAASFESAFSGVERTTLDAAGNSIAGLEGIRESLVDLSTEMPVAFDEISRIATLGAQLGVPAEELAKFSEVVAKFSTVTGMTADATAQAFGRLSNLLGIPISEAERLGSAIAKVGVDSASTEPEIVALAQRLASTAKRAGFTTDQVVGLSGALGSLGVAPERAQGVFETYFNSLNESLAEGGKKLEYFAQITGLSTDALNTMVRSGDGFTVFTKFLSGLQGADSVQMTAALDELGLSGLRANEVVGRIAGNLPLLKSAFDDAAVGFSEGTELQNQYAIIADDLNSQLQTLGNSLLALWDAGGQDLIPGLADAIGGLADLVNGARDFVASGFGAALFRVGTILMTAAGLFFAYKAAVALATASTYALVTANTALAAVGSRGGILGLVSAMTGLTKQNQLARTSSLRAAAGNEAVASTATTAAGATNAAAVGTSRFAGALKAVGRATLVLAVLQLLAEVVFNFGESAVTVAKIWVWAEGIISGSLNAIAAQARKLNPILGGIADLIEGFAGLGVDNANGFSKWADTLIETEDAAEGLDEALPLAEWEDGFGAVGDSVDDVAAKVVTLADYASDLGGVMSRAFDIRFGGGQAADQIASSWNDIAEASRDNAKAIEDSAEATKDAEQALRDYRAEANQLNADRSILLYFKSVADAYGDTLRSADLAAQIEKNKNDLAKSAAGSATAQIALTAAATATAEAQRTATMSLVGNSAEAIANRAQILGLVTSYQGYLAALASSGMSQEDLRAKSVELKAEFQAQAAQAGFSATEIDLYAVAFDGMTLAIDRVPRNITVDANTDPAMQALTEFLAAAAASSVSVPVDFIPTSDPTNLFGKLTAAERGIGKKGSYTVGGGGGGGGGGGFADGGYTGDGGTASIAGAVHGKEFVFSAPATKAIGVDKLAYMHKVAKSGRGYRDGGYVGSGGSGGSLLGGGITSLSPDDRALLRAIEAAVRNHEVEFVDVARAAAEGDAIIGTRGGR